MHLGEKNPRTLFPLAKPAARTNKTNSLKPQVCIYMNLLTCHAPHIFQLIIVLNSWSWQTTIFMQRYFCIEVHQFVSSLNTPVSDIEGWDWRSSVWQSSSSFFLRLCLKVTQWGCLLHRSRTPHKQTELNKLSMQQNILSCKWIFSCHRHRPTCLFEGKELRCLYNHCYSQSLLFFS